jgi:predicted dienelactone hydrolase
VLDELTAIEHGHNPDVDHHRLPEGLRGSLDLDRVGVFGHSLGGATSAATMLDDSRITAGINMDGAMYGPVVTTGLNRPFMLLASTGKAPGGQLLNWGPFRNASTGWKRAFILQGSLHLSYSDAEALFPQIGFPPKQLQGIIGTIDPQRALTIQTAYVTSLFDLHLRHRDNHLLDGQSTQFPEMLFQP